MAALAIAASLERENQLRQACGEAPVRVRIGINTGTISAGTVGGAGRATYAAVGDAVNAAQRIEQLGKTLCQDRPTAAILLGEATAERLGGAFALEAVGKQSLRGRSRAEAVFRLRGLQPMAEAQRGARLLTPAE
jgi:adenylate cyclase